MYIKNSSTEPAIQQFVILQSWKFVLSIYHIVVQPRVKFAGVDS